MVRTIWRRREVAVRVLRLAFAGERRRRQWVYIEDCRPPTRCDAFFINRLLRVVPLKQARFTGCPCPLDRACRFDGGRVVTRLQEFGGPGPWLRAVCRRVDGFLLRVSGDLPLRADRIEVRILRTGHPLEFGLSRETGGRVLEVRTQTPEEIIFFSACQAREEALLLMDGPRWTGPKAWVVVGLRDFEGEETELPVVAGRPRAEAWLERLPGRPLRLSRSVRGAILRWLLPPCDWLDDECLEKLNETFSRIGSPR